MPNHIANRLTIVGTDKQIKSVLKFIKGGKEDRFIDFNKIVPQTPEVLASIENNSGASPLWHSWRLANWGTKWGAYDQEKLDSNRIQFDTAWSMPFEIYAALSKKFPEVTFETKWSDEDTSYNCGTATFLNGADTTNELDGGSKEAFELYFELHPGNDEYYVFNEESGTYEYIEDDEEDDEVVPETPEDK